MKLKNKIFITLILLSILAFNSVKFNIKTEEAPKSAQSDRLSFVIGEGGTGATLDDWDPAIATTSQFGALETLVSVDFDLQSYPALATSWTVHARPDEGGNTGGVAAISFNLRQGVEFMDGSKFNASVVKWNWDRLLNITGLNIAPNNRRTSVHWFDPSGMTPRFTPNWNLSWAASDPFGLGGRIPFINETIIVSEYVVNFTLNKWVTSMFYFTEGAMISSKEYAAFATTPIRGYAGSGVEHLIGTGPYQFAWADQVVNQTALSVKNENYWNKVFLEAQGLFVVDDWYTKWYATPEERSTALLAGDIDASGYQVQNRLTDMVALNASPYHEIYPTVFDASYATVQFSCRENNDKPVALLGGLTLRQYWPTWAAANGLTGVPLAQGVNKSVRQAISWAFDYEDYMNVQYADIGAVRTDSPLGTECVWNDHTVPYPVYNLTKARQKLFSDPYYAAILTARGLNITSPDSAWVGESATPIELFTYLGDASTPHKTATMKAALNNLGFDLTETISTNIDSQWMYTKKAMMFDMFTYIWPTGKLDPFGWMGVGMKHFYSSNSLAIPLPSFNFAMLQNSTVDYLMNEIPWAGTEAQPMYNNLTSMLLEEAGHLYISHAQKGVVANAGWIITPAALEFGGPDGTDLNIAFIGGDRIVPLIFELKSPKNETYTTLENGGLALEYYCDKNLNWTGYSLDGQANVTFSGNTTIPMPANGIHSIQVFGYNWSGNTYQTEVRYFTVDIPVYLISPENKTYTSLENGGLKLEYYSRRIFILTSYSLDGQANITFSGNTTIPMPFNGPHSIQVFGNDSLGNTYQTEIKYFTVDISVYLISPENKTYTSLENGGLALEYYCSKSLVWTSYSLDNDADITFSGNTTIPMPFNGPHWIQVFGNDSLGNTHQTEIKYFTVGIPSELISPHNTTYTTLENGGLTLEYHINEPLVWTWYSLDDGTNVTISGNAMIPMPSNGPHSIQVFGNDSLGNTYQTEIRYFSVELSLEIINPQDRTYTSLENGGLSLEYYFCKNLTYTSYSLDNGPYIAFSGNTTIPMPSNGLHSISVFGSDSDGNIYQSEERFFIVEYSGEVSPPSVPGYPIGVIFISIMISVIGLVYLTKKH